MAEQDVGNLVVGDGVGGIGDGGTASLGRLWPNAWGWQAGLDASERSAKRALGLRISKVGFELERLATFATRSLRLNRLLRPEQPNMPVGILLGSRRESLLPVPKPLVRCGTTSVKSLAMSDDYPAYNKNRSYDGNCMSRMP